MDHKLCIIQFRVTNNVTQSKK